MLLLVFSLVLTLGIYTTEGTKNNNNKLTFTKCTVNENRYTFPVTMRKPILRTEQKCDI